MQIQFSHQHFDGGVGWHRKSRRQDEKMLGKCWLNLAMALYLSLPS